MKTTEIKIVKIEADKGKILTDGNTYRRVRFLSSDETADKFYEIPEEEYEKIMRDAESEAECDGFGT